jgi:hypothetical protein
MYGCTMHTIARAIYDCTSTVGLRHYCSTAFFVLTTNHRPLVIQLTVLFVVHTVYMIHGPIYNVLKTITVLLAHEL